MKLKKSYFNPTIFWKDIKQCWPLWTIYLAVLIFALPLRALLSFGNAERYAMYPTGEMLYTLSDILSPNFMIVVNVIWAVVIAVIVFRYLNSSASANMIHSFPVSREELFMTHTASGLAMLIVPEIITFVLTIITCFAYAVSSMTAVLLWLLFSLALSVIMYSIAIFSVFMTGNSLAVFFFYALFHWLYWIIRVTVMVMLSFFAFGVDLFDSLSTRTYWDALCPFTYLIDKTSVYTRRDITSAGNSVVTRVEFQMSWVVLIYVIVALLLFAASLLIYKKRKLEYARDMVAIPALRPIMRWGIGIIAGVIMGFLTVSFMDAMEINIGTVGLILASLIFAFIGFFASQMIIARSFKVFKKRMLLESLSFLCSILVIIGVTGLLSIYVERRLPDPEDVEYVYFSLNYPVESTDVDTIADIVDIQKLLVENKDAIFDRDIYHMTNDDINVSYIYMRYVMKNGNRIIREYPVYLNDKGYEIIEAINEIELDHEIFERYLYGSAYGQDFYISSLTFDHIDKETNMWSPQYVENETTIDVLWDAIQKDMEDGNFQKAYLYVSADDYKQDRLMADINLDIRYEVKPNVVQTVGVAPKDMAVEELYYNSIYLPISRSCSNTLNALIECGLIESSVGDLMTEEEYESNYYYDYDYMDDYYYYDEETGEYYIE